MALGDKSFYAPVSLIKNIFKKPVTVRYPKEILRVFPKEGVSPCYRGMHSNDLEKCIGCGNCAAICPVNAIEMKTVGQNDKGRDIKKPVFDYGRCCFCAFCVDMCPTGSLIMTRKYIYKIKTIMDKSPEEDVKYVQKQFKFMPDSVNQDDPGYISGKAKKVLG